MNATAAPSTNGTGKSAFYADADCKPTVLPVEPAGIPADLRDRPQWVCWRLEKRDEKWTKLPINPRTGNNAKTTDLMTWGTFADALTLYRTGKADGVGFVFSSADPFAGIDLDDCRDPQTGAVAEWARPILVDLDSYTDVSPSGTGLKIIARGRLPGPGRRAVYGDGEIEMYDRERYFALTGMPWRAE